VVVIDQITYDLSVRKRGGEVVGPDAVLQTDFVAPAQQEANDFVCGLGVFSNIYDGSPAVFHADLLDLELQRRPVQDEV